MGKQRVSVNMSMDGKNIIIAYLLWWFLGYAGVHRFYLGRIGTGLTQLFLTIIGAATVFLIVGYAFLAVVGLWWLLDAYLTYVIVQEENQKRGLYNSTLHVSSRGSTGKDIEQLEKLHALYEKGVITRAQYEKKKADLL